MINQELDQATQDTAYLAILLGANRSQQACIYVAHIGTSRRNSIREFMSNRSEEGITEAIEAISNLLDDVEIIISHSEPTLSNADRADVAREILQRIGQAPHQRKDYPFYAKTVWQERNNFYAYIHQIISEYIIEQEQTS